MRNFSSTITERKIELTSDFNTHPYEGGWASEAISFIRVENLEGSGVLNARVQISVDGVRWIDEGTVHSPITEKGDYFVKVTHFGGYLRLRSTIEGEAKFKLTIWWVLKE